MLRFNKCRIASIPRIYVGGVGTRREWQWLCGPARDGRIDGGAYRGRGWLTRYGNRKWRCLRSKQPQAPSPGLESCDSCFISWHLCLSLRSLFLDFIFYLQGLKFWLAIWAWKGGCGEFASFSVRPVFARAARGPAWLWSSAAWTASVAKDNSLASFHAGSQRLRLAEVCFIRHRTQHPQRHATLITVARLTLNNYMCHPAAAY